MTYEEQKNGADKNEGEIVVTSFHSGSNFVKRLVKGC